MFTSHQSLPRLNVNNRSFCAIFPPSPSRKILTEFLDEETRLVKFLFDDYVKTIPAIYTRARTQPDTPNLPLLANVILMYAKTVDMNEPEQTIKMIAESYFIWEDMRLVWDPANFSGIDFIMTGRDKVWIPDIIPFDLADYLEPIDPERQTVMIYANGTVAFYAACVATFMCHLDISNFPFDQQQCSIQYSAYYSTTSELLFNPSIEQTFDFTEVGSNAWNYIGHSIVNSSYYYNVYNRSYSLVYFSFTFQRSDGYYIVLIIIPSFVLTFLCIAGLFWAPISFETYMDKLNLGFAAILAMVLVLQITTDSIPKTSQTPILSIFSLINLSLITLASLQVLIIGKYHSRKRKSTSSHPLLLFFRSHIHIICLIGYTCATVINLVVLLTRRGSSQPLNPNNPNT